MDQRVPSPVQEMLTDYLNGLEVYIPGVIEGCYLHGSIALEAFDQGSDVDFLVLVNHDLTCQEMIDLMDLHGELSEKYPRFMMQGSYVNSKVMEQSPIEFIDSKYPFGEREGIPFTSPYFDGFTLTKSSEEWYNPITWWLIKHHGICLKGIRPKDLPLSISEEHIVNYVHRNMNQYWKKRVERFWQVTNQGPEEIPDIEIDAEIEWTVLGLLRQMYTLQEHEVISKLGAAEYGLDYLPHNFHPIIEEAVRLRKRKQPSPYRSTQAKLEDTYKLSHFIFEKAASIQNHIV